MLLPVCCGFLPNPSDPSTRCLARVESQDMVDLSASCHKVYCTAHRALATHACHEPKNILPPLPQRLVAKSFSSSCPQDLFSSRIAAVCQKHV